MGVLKYSSVWYGGGGVDIANTLSIPVPEPPEPPEGEQAPEYIKAVEEEVYAEPEISAEEILARRESELALRERRAEGILQNAEQEAAEIVSDAEKNRDDVFIKARAEGYEQGKRDGVAACLTAGQSVLDEAREFSDNINEQKAELFERYEKEIYETVMEIANKVTLGSMSVKDGTAAKKLIKKAAKEFRNTQFIRITLEENGATTELSGDYEYLKELCAGAEHIEVELLKDAEVGTVIIDNGEEITDAGIQTQLKMIKELGDGKFRTGTPKKRKKAAKTEEEAESDSEE